MLDVDKILSFDQKGTFVLLFVDDSITSQVAQEHFIRCQLPPGVEGQAVPISKNCQLCSWFGIEYGPCLAVISQGQLLAIETEISQESVNESLDFACRQLMQKL